jgi:oxygen-independent coproporphyrinogen-3 oxidase
VKVGLYIHVPFCTSVCPYCDFSVLIAGEERRRDYLEMLDREAALSADLELEFDTVYLGGGTPSCLDPGQLGSLLDAVGRRLVIRQEAVRYLEVNPEDVTEHNVRAWRGLGIGTVSLGVQSFNDAVLVFLGRRHTAEQARRALELLQGGGFDTVSIDLIYGHDGQTPDQWRAELSEAIGRAPDHVSCYQLTLHEGTVFGRRLTDGSLREPPEPRQAELFFLTHNLLQDAGYDGYEVSNFAAADRHRSHHNTKYWTHQPYLGLGPSAHSFSGRRRWWNRRKLRLWSRALAVGESPLAGDEDLSVEELALEAVMLGLRTSDGIDLDGLLASSGIDLLGRNPGTVGELESTGHLTLEKRRLRPTLRGMAIADSLALRLLA